MTTHLEFTVHSAGIFLFYMNQFKLAQRWARVGVWIKFHFDHVDVVLHPHLKEIRNK